MYHIDHHYFLSIKTSVMGTLLFLLINTNTMEILLGVETGARVCSLIVEVTLLCESAFTLHSLSLQPMTMMMMQRFPPIVLCSVFGALQLVATAGLIPASQCRANLRGQSHKLCWTLLCLRFTLLCLVRQFFSNPHKFI